MSVSMDGGDIYEFDTCPECDDEGSSEAGEKFEFYSNHYELGDYTAYVEAGTLPLLLCLAALKAKGVTGEQHG